MALQFNPPPIQRGPTKEEIRQENIRLILQGLSTLSGGVSAFQDREARKKALELRGQEAESKEARSQELLGIKKQQLGLEERRTKSLEDLRKSKILGQKDESTGVFSVDPGAGGVTRIGEVPKGSKVFKRTDPKTEMELIKRKERGVVMNLALSTLKGLRSRSDDEDGLEPEDLEEARRLAKTLGIKLQETKNFELFGPNKFKINFEIPEKFDFSLFNEGQDAINELAKPTRNQGRKQNSSGGVIPAPSGASPQVPQQLPQAGGQQGPEEIRAAFRRGEISREQAKQMLRALGVQ